MRPSFELSFELLTTRVLGPRTLGPDWLDPQQIIESLGPWAMVGITAIIFAECGLLIGFFLPGDSLFFVAGLLIASGFIDTPIGLACLHLHDRSDRGKHRWLLDRPQSRASNLSTTRLAALPAGLRRQDSALLRPLRQPRHRPRAVCADCAHLHHRDGRRGAHGLRSYFLYSTIGGILWATGLTLLGYFLGNIEFVADNIEAIALGIVALSIIPIFFELRRHRRANPSTDAPAEG